MLRDFSKKSLSLTSKQWYRKLAFILQLTNQLFSLIAECFTDHYTTVSAATESIQFDGRAVTLGTGTALLHVPTSSAQAPSALTPTDLRSSSPTSQSSSPAPSQTHTATISPSTTDQRSANDGDDDVKSITQLLQQSAQHLFRTQLDMPPPTSPSPRKVIQRKASILFGEIN